MFSSIEGAAEATARQAKPISPETAVSQSESSKRKREPSRIELEESKGDGHKGDQGNPEE